MDSKLVKKIDAAFQEFIRLRDLDHDDMFVCISCGKRKPHFKPSGEPQLDAGHFWSRRHMSTRWHEKNVHGQCKYCNHHLDGNGAGYAQGLRKKYGEQILDELEALKNKELKLTDYEGELILKEYREKNKKLRKEKKEHKLKRLTL